MNTTIKTTAYSIINDVNVLNACVDSIKADVKSGNTTGTKHGLKYFVRALTLVIF